LIYVSPKGINNKGTVLFESMVSDASGNVATGVFTVPAEGAGLQSKLLVKPGDTIDGKKLLFLNPGTSAINNKGTVAFFGEFSAQGGGCCSSGIFTESSLVAQAGDVVGGKSPVGQSVPININDRGDIVFQAGLSDGSSAIILAQPKGNGQENENEKER